MLQELIEQRDAIREFLADTDANFNPVEYYENLELLPKLNKQIAQLTAETTGQFSNLY